jgi:hypothetical protein
MTLVYLAYAGSRPGRFTYGELASKGIDINLLVSFYYIDHYRDRSRIMPRHPLRMLDSGAYSAWNSGKAIDIEALIAETKNDWWTESVSLDVVGDPDAGMKNAIYMKSRGSPAYPVFHVGDPWEHLDEYKRQFPKVGLSCRFGETEKESYRFLETSFSRAWPHKFHSFGWVDERMLMRFPFHSVDTASWNNGPGRFGRWNAFGGKMPIWKAHSFIAEVEWYLRLQERLKSRWRKTLSILG